MGIMNSFALGKFPYGRQWGSNLIQMHPIAYVSLEKVGGRTGARTPDPLIKSQLLYQLSYAPTL